MRFRLPSLTLFWPTWWVFGASLAGYQFGLSLFLHSDRVLSPIWPPVGLAFGVLMALGSRAVPMLFLGGFVRLSLFGDPWYGALLIPALDVAEGLLAWWLWRRLSRRYPGQGVLPVLRAFLMIPLLTGAVMALPAMLVARLNGLPMGNDPMTNWAVIASARIASMMTLAPFAWHFFRGDFYRRGDLVSALPVAVLQGILVLMTTFGFFWDSGTILPTGAAIYLPFAVLVLVGVFCPPSQASISMVLVATISSFLTARGYGPLVAADTVASLFLLAVYQSGLGGMAYLLSTGAQALQEQAQLLRLMMDSGKLAPWTWTRDLGLKMQAGTRLPVPLPGDPGFPSAATDQLVWMGCPEPGRPDERWSKVIECDEPGGSRILQCQGLVTARSPGGHPLAATGVFHDLSKARRFRATQIELAYQQERLRGLQSQLNPHFLFNSLNTVRALIGLDPDAARGAVTALSSILRATLKFETRTKVPLREELKIVRHFLRLQHLRHRERLHSRLRVTRAASLCPVPPLLVLNMVENAIIHGIDKLRAGGRVNVVCLIEDGALQVRVTNPGTLVMGDRVGIGIENTRQRLAILYGPGARFQLTSPSENLVLAHATIPIFSDA